jgi:hypothetical protein
VWVGGCIIKPNAAFFCFAKFEEKYLHPIYIKDWQRGKKIPQRKFSIYIPADIL